MNRTRAGQVPFSIKLLLTGAFLMNMGGFMIVPFLTVYLSHMLGFPAWEVGTVLTINLIFSSGLQLFTGLLGDRISHSTTMFCGVFIRGLGFCGYGVFHDFAALVGAAMLVGVGGALYSPSVSAVFAKQPEESRKRIFTYYNQALNAGTILGPLIGGALIAMRPALPFSVGGSLYVILAVLLFLYRRHYQTERTTSKVGETLGALYGNRRYMRFLGSMVLFWIVFTQLNVSLPVQVFNIMHDESYISTVFLCNGIMGIVIMFVLRKSFETQPPIRLLQRGVLLMGAGLLLVPWLQSLGWLLVCVLLYSIGETYALPASDLAVSEFSSSSPHTGSYFGLFDITYAIGGSIGNYLGTWLMGVSNREVPWVLYALICLLAAVSLLAQKGQPIMTNK